MYNSFYKSKMCILLLVLKYKTWTHLLFVGCNRAILIYETYKPISYINVIFEVIYKNNSIYNIKCLDFN